MTIALLGQLPVGNSNWIALFIGVGAIAFVMFRPRSKKKDPLESGPRFSLAQQRGVERQMQNLLVEMSEMARQISAQLDTRSAKLEALIKEADEKIAILKSSSSVPHSPTLAPQSFHVDPRHLEIYNLADRGFSAADIAAKVERPKGEVELILALRPSRVA